MSSKPTILIPYEGPSEDPSVFDIFVYLRPETNGILVESTLFKVVQQSSVYRESVKLGYLANIPGDFIVEEGIVERHYRYKLPFAYAGGTVFTNEMIRRFETHFRARFDPEIVVGAFEFLQESDMSEEELFDAWVPAEDILSINCQTVKRIGDRYVVDYDIPALLHKNNLSTDIAVMMFRSSLSHERFGDMIRDMGEALRRQGIIDRTKTVRRAFHYSRGPFEQVLDAEGHLYRPDGTPEDLSHLQFCRFLDERGVDCHVVQMALTYPIMTFKSPSGEAVEDCLFAYTEGDSLAAAHEKLQSVVAQFLVR